MEGDVGGRGVHFIPRTRDKKNLDVTVSASGCHKQSGTAPGCFLGGVVVVAGVNYHTSPSLSVLKKRSNTLASLTFKAKLALA